MARASGPDEAWLTIPEAAERLGLSRGTLRLWLRTGRLRGRRTGRGYVGRPVPESEVRRLLAERAPITCERCGSQAPASRGKRFCSWACQREAANEALRAESARRRAEGTARPRGARLTWAEVREMRRRHREEEARPRELAADYPVSVGHVRGILGGRYWREAD